FPTSRGLPARRHVAAEEFRREDALRQGQDPFFAPGRDRAVRLEATVGEFLDPIARIRMGAGTMAREDPAQVEHLLARSPRPPDRRLVGVGGAMTEMPPAGDGNFDE